MARRMTQLEFLMALREVEREADLFAVVSSRALRVLNPWAIWSNAAALASG